MLLTSGRLLITVLLVKLCLIGHHHHVIVVVVRLCQLYRHPRAVSRLDTRACRGIIMIVEFQIISCIDQLYRLLVLVVMISNYLLCRLVKLLVVPLNTLPLLSLHCLALLGNTML